MKFIWQEQDIDCGRRVAKKESKEIWLIGHDITYEEEDRYTLVSFVDGAIRVRMTKTNLVGILNSGEYEPLSLPERRDLKNE